MPDTLFDMPEAPIVTPTKIAAMHRMFGMLADKRCKTCNHLRVKRMGGTYYKCDLTRQTAGPGTDWRTGYVACGKYEAVQDA